MNYNNQDISDKINLKFNSNNSLQNTLMYQNSSNETTPESNKKNSLLFKVNNILNKNITNNMKYLKLFKNNEKSINEDNNYIDAISILINKMNMNDLISLKKFINQKIEFLIK